VALFVFAAVLGWVGFADQAKKTNEAVKARQEADEARKEAEKASAKLAANLELSLKAFEAVFDAASGNRQGYGMVGWLPPERHGFPNGRGPDGPGGPGPKGFGGGPGDHGPGGPRGPDGNSATDTSAKMLEAVLAFYDKFAEKNSTDPDLQLEAAKAHRRVGEARMWLGDSSKAKTSFARAFGLLRTLQEKYPEKDKYALELVLTYMSAPPEIVVMTEELLVWSLEIARGRDMTEQPYLVGMLSLRLGTLRDRAGNKSGAEEAYHEAIVGLSAPKNSEDNRPAPVVTDRAWTRYYLSTLLINSKRFQDAQSLLTELIGELDNVTERNGRNSRPQENVKSLAYQQLAVAYEQLGDLTKASDALKTSQEVQQRMNKGGPGPDGPGGFPGQKGPPPKKY
jgi:eukaryotic-like serine/threonine-protein kinase